MVALVPGLQLYSPEGHRQGWSWSHHYGNRMLLPSPLCDRWRNPGKVTWLRGQSWNSNLWTSGRRGLEEALVSVREGGSASPSVPYCASPNRSLDPCFFENSVGTPVFHFPGPSLGIPSPQQFPLSSFSSFPHLPGRGWHVPKAQGEETTWARSR